MQVLDYSDGKPGAARIKAAGFVGAVRYIGQPGYRKNTTAAELQDFTAHGLGMGLVFEARAGNWRGGFLQGQVDGRLARSHANTVGFSRDRPIYMAVDQDVVSAGEFLTVVEYLRGASGPLGGVGLTGVYGEHDVMVRAQQARVAAWFWQTRAWSTHLVDGHRVVNPFPGRHLYQNAEQTAVAGITCDLNDVERPDWGQHNHHLEDDMTPDDHAKIAAAAQSAADDAAKQAAKFITGAGGSSLFNDTLAGNEWMRTAPTVGKALAAVRGIDVDEAAIAATVLAGLNPAVIAAAIPEDIATDVADLLAVRLAG